MCFAFFKVHSMYIENETSIGLLLFCGSNCLDKSSASCHWHHIHPSDCQRLSRSNFWDIFCISNTEVGSRMATLTQEGTFNNNWSDSSWTFTSIQTSITILRVISLTRETHSVYPTCIFKKKQNKLSLPIKSGMIG